MTGSLATFLTPCPPLPSGEGEPRANCVSPLPKGEGIKGVRTERAAGARAKDLFRERRILLIYDPYSGRGRKRELAPRHPAVHPDVPQDYRALLACALHDVHAVYQGVLPTHPDRRFAIGLVVPLRHEPDDVGWPSRPPAVRERVGPDVLRRVTGVVLGVYNQRKRPSATIRSPLGAVKRMEKRLGRIWYSRPRVVSGVPIIGFVMICTKLAERLVTVW